MEEDMEIETPKKNTTVPYERLLARFADFEARMTRIEEDLRCLKDDQSSSKGGLADHLAESLDSLVGIREMLTGRRRFMQWIWAFLFALGTGGTIYFVYAGAVEYMDKKTATNVELKRRPFYEYPSLVLCPGSWIDTEKAYAKGLSKHALQYAMAYLAWEFAENPSSINVSEAQSEFQNFYQSHGYQKLLDFYLDMTVEPVRARSSDDLSNIEGPGYCCVNCIDESPMERVIVRDMMCYAFKFKPADARHVQTFVSHRQVALQMRNEHDGDFLLTSNWFGYLMPDAHILQPNVLSMAIEQYAVSTLKTSISNFVTLNNYNDDDSKCLTPDELPTDKYYSSERCAAKCLHDYIEDRTGCGIFYYSAYDDLEHPQHFCNFFDPLPKMPNVSLAEFKDTEEIVISQSEASAACLKKCPYPCNREIFTSTFDSRFPIVLDDSNLTANARRRNLSLVVVNVAHEALTQGGVLTLAEVDTYSFTTLVSNVGGTLGLFIGGTIMSIFQVILWAIDYYLDQKERRRTKVIKCELKR